LRQGGEARRAVDEAVDEINGVRGRPETFDRLERLLSEQSYRLSYWRVAADEINYRRFFDINELAAVRVEERPVFTAVHDRLLRLMARGLVTGLRIDHVDGLFNPEKYLHDLRRECAALAARGAAATIDAPAARAEYSDDSGGGQDGRREVEQEAGEGREAEQREHVSAGIAQQEGGRQGPACYVVDEKILGHDELLRREWPVHGTTGYDFLNLLGGLFVDGRAAQAFRELYAEFTGARTNFADLVYACKKLVLRVAMSSELHVLARRLARISERQRSSRDFTFNSLHDALGEVVACFPVYRTYIRRRQDLAGADDRLHINSAVAAARLRNPSLSGSIFDFIASVLLLDDPKGTTPAQRAERRDFVMRFQQLTSPVMAKGLEDTAFYRYYPLASLCEVGGEPAIFGTPLARFHRRNLSRQEQWPHALSATSTHDTKRGEDVRARINVLSEMPEEWNRAVHRWREMNRARRTRLDGVAAPDANEEYLFYQTLVGAWPFAPMKAEEHAAFAGRIVEYMRKALREAKLHTSWINQNEEYERAVDEFVRAALDPEGEAAAFLADFVEFQRATARAGVYNSLAQTLLKIASPGVPDFYQGTELWQLDLVDPDNRRPVDYAHRRALLASLDAGDAGGDRAAFAERLLREPEDGRVKLYVTSRALRFRRSHPDLFARGEYVPLAASGESAAGVVAFARRLGDGEVLAVAGRFFTRLANRHTPGPPLGVEAWGDTSLALGERLAAGRFRDVFTGVEVTMTEGRGGGSLGLATIFSRLPVALLERV
jgi:(1->4)-alpha-D-glucan 1-alpha-D-glucosylmutase